jgi:hypothetical protein
VPLIGDTGMRCIGATLQQTIAPACKRDSRRALQTEKPKGEAPSKNPRARPYCSPRDGSASKIRALRAVSPASLSKAHAPAPGIAFAPAKSPLA